MKDIKITENDLLEKYLVKFSDCSILFEAISKEQKEKSQKK